MEKGTTGKKTGRDEQKALFQVAFVFYASATYMQTTMYTQFAPLAALFVYMRYAAFAILCLLIAASVRDALEKSRLKKAAGKISAGRYLFWLIAAGGAAAASSVVSGDRTPLYAVGFLFAAKPRYLEETFRIAFALQLGLMVFVVAGSTFGWIPDLLIKRDVIPIRHSLGFTYPSVCSAYFYFLLVLYLWIFEKKITGRDLLWMEALNWLVFLLTDSRMSFLLVTLLLLCAYLFCCRGKDRQMERWIRRQRRKRKFIYRAGAVLYDYFAVFLSAVFALWCLIDVSLGGESILDRALSGRLKYTVSVVRRYGVRLFGSAVDWVGFGGAQDTDALLESYNFVDCSYAYILLSYGIIFFVLVMIYVVLLQKYVRRREGVWRCVLLLAVWSYCLLEPRLLELQANCLLLLGASLLRPGERWEGAGRDG